LPLSNSANKHEAVHRIAKNLIAQHKTAEALAVLCSVV